MGDGELRKRLRAAQVIAGFKSVDELAGRIAIEGLGKDTLYDMQRGKRAIRRHELREIADACGLPMEFFTEDFDRMRTPEPGIAEHDARSQKYTAQIIDAVQVSARAILERLAAIEQTVTPTVEARTEVQELLGEAEEAAQAHLDGVPQANSASPETRSATARRRAANG
jgi:hypothetical protein